MEQARIKYIQYLKLWDGKDFDKIGWVLAEQSCRYITPIKYGQKIRVGVRTSRLGRKSLELIYSIQDAETGEEVAFGKSIQVAYDYKQDRSIVIPDKWRKTISEFEKLNT